MAAHAGETAEETGDFRCERCHQTTHVTKGHKIPKCSHCWSCDVRHTAQ
ncbi:zinc ribbon-containing protein [Bradyrhizobium sp. USDA 4353]